jgi:hypothetical protein
MVLIQKGSGGNIGKGAITPQLVNFSFVAASVILVALFVTARLKTDLKEWKNVPRISSKV